MDKCLPTSINTPDQDGTEEPPQKITKLDDAFQIDKEEDHFLKLYSLVLDEVMKLHNVREEGVRDSIKVISDSFKTGESRFDFDKIDFSKWENVCGYLYRYGSHGAGLARNRILKALEDCSNLIKLAVIFRCGFPTEGPENDSAGLDSALVEWYRANGACSDLMNTLQRFDASCVQIERVSDLRLIVLGSGPGNDAVGLCSALAEWYRTNNWKCPSNVTVTLVDKYKELLLCAERAIKLIDSQRENFGNAGKLFNSSTVKFNYVQIDITDIPRIVSTGTREIVEEFEENIFGKEFVKERNKYFEELKNADVIVISKLLSILTLNQCDSIIESLKERMKKGAFIFLIDQYLDYKWDDDFKLIHFWEADTYQSSARAEPRFDACDDVTSVFGIRILRLKS